MKCQKNRNTINKWTDELNRQFPKEEQMPNKYMKNTQNP
jgi:hypothetical protein